MILCPNCKKEISEDTKFCPECGISIGATMRIMQEIAYSMTPLPSEENEVPASIPLTPVSEFYCSCGKHYAICSVDTEDQPVNQQNSFNQPEESYYTPSETQEYQEEPSVMTETFGNYPDYQYQMEQNPAFQASADASDYEGTEFYDGQNLDELREQKKNEVSSGFFATPGKRMIAGFIDNCAILGAGYFLYDKLLSAQLMEGLSTNAPLTQILSENAGKIGAIAFFMLAIYFVYNIVIAFLLQGQTLGKKLMKIRIISQADENKPNFVTLCKRELLGKFLSALFIFIGYIMVLTDKNEHKAMHDRFANTFVVNM